MMVPQGLGHKAGPKEHNARSTLTITQGGMLLKVVAMVMAIVHNVEKAKLDLVHHQHPGLHKLWYPGIRDRST